MEGGLPTSSDVQVVIVIDEEDGALQPLTSSHTPRLVALWLRICCRCHVLSLGLFSPLATENCFAIN